VEEQQLQDIVHRIYTDDRFRQALLTDPQGVIEQEHLAPLVSNVVKKLIPHLSLGETLGPPLWWWHP
jgi:hypothetical protein